MEQIVKEKYTLGQSAATFSLVGVCGAIVFFLLVIPFGLLGAWMRSCMWNWFAVPYLHAPHVGILPMFGLGLLIGTLYTSQPALKDDLLKYAAWKASLYNLIGNLLAFLLAYIIHIWVLPIR